MAKRTFREMVTSGSVIASAPVEEAQFRRIITNINKQFGLTLAASKETYELFQDRIRFVAGRFWDELGAVDRKAVLDRVTKLRNNIRSSIVKLLPLRGGLHEAADMEVVSLLLRAPDPAHAGQYERSREELEANLRALEDVEARCEGALALLAELPAQRGQPRLRWYDELVDLMMQVAELIGVKVTTAGDRSEDPYATPFTVLVFEAERVLPEGAWSPNLAACAKRIESSLKRLQRPLRKNSTKSG
jgi:hypothetical protein